jgi:hypothetical protein
MKKLIFTFAVVIATTLNMAAQIEVAMGFSYASASEAIATAQRYDTDWIEAKVSENASLGDILNFQMYVNGVKYSAGLVIETGKLLIVDAVTKQRKGLYQVVKTEETTSGQLVLTLRNDLLDGGFTYAAMFIN